MPNPPNAAVVPIVQTTANTDTLANDVIPLPAALAAVWGAFLYEGLLAHIPDKERNQQILDTWNQGCVELVIAATAFLPEVWHQASTTWEGLEQDLPGVFEYEVISPLGVYLGDYLLFHDGLLPDVDTMKRVIHAFIRDFFRQQAA